MIEPLVLTEVNTAHQNIRIVLSGVRDVAEAENVELAVPISARGMNREQNGPCDEDSHKGDGAQHAQEPQEQIPIQGGVMKHMIVLHLEKGPKPIDPACRQFRTPLAVGQDLAV